MDTLLDQLDALPQTILDPFVRWCLLEQARPAFAEVLDKAALGDQADAVRSEQDAERLLALSNEIRAMSAQTRVTSTEIPAPEAAAFEFSGLVTAALPDGWDPEEAAFFAARVVGWAAWARGDFKSPADKVLAERAARQAQEDRLQALWRDHQSGDQV